MNRLALTVPAACLLLAASLFLAGRASTVAPDKKAEIEKVIRASIGWALTKDRALLEKVIAHDDRLFIVNPDTHSTVGWKQFTKGFAFWMDERFKMVSYEIRNLRIDMAISGTTAWWSCVLDEHATWDGRVCGWEDTRWTGVIEKRAGKWLIVQMHFSFAAK